MVGKLEEQSVREFVLPLDCMLFEFHSGIRSAAVLSYESANMVSLAREAVMEFL